MYLFRTEFAKLITVFWSRRFEFVSPYAVPLKNNASWIYFYCEYSKTVVLGHKSDFFRGVVNVIPESCCSRIIKSNRLVKKKKKIAEMGLNSEY